MGYMGHSQGTIQAFAGFSRLQELAKKVKVFVALAPVAYVNKQRSLLLKVIAGVGTDKILQALGTKKFLTKGAISKFAPWLCRLTPGVCQDVIELLVGPSHHMNKSR